MGERSRAAARTARRRTPTPRRRRTTINAHYTDPAIAREIWRLVQDLGFSAGRVLEPGCGAGVFLSFAPEGARLTGVELDPTTAAIAAALNPHADIRAESFAATRLPDGSFDATVGNVPFADVRLHDPRHNSGHHSLHNHFIVKSLALTRPGGLAALLTSHYTLDAANPAARREIAQLADLIGAVRLPTGAHRRAAGTDALTDLLIFRRRQPQSPPRSTEWQTTQLVDVDGRAVRINSYLADHPDRILGELAVGHGMYSSDALLVRPRGALDTLPAQLHDVLCTVVREARADGLTFAPSADTSSGPTRQSATDVSPAAARSEGLWDGHLAVDEEGTFSVVGDGVHEPFDVPRAHRSELRQLLGLRDSARELLTAEATTLQDTSEIAELRARLRSRYGSYVSRYGPINRFTLRRTGRVDAQTGEERMARVVPPAVRVFRSDPFAALVAALEVFDDASQTAAPAGILSERVVAPRAPRLGADSAQDALAICLDTRGRVELRRDRPPARRSTSDARAQLGELVYHDPASDQLVAAAEYLSGNVRAKLERARHAAQRDPALEVNVAALERVLPPELTIEEIEPRLGAAWIDADTHRQFLAETAGGPIDPGRASRRRDLGGQRQQLLRAGHQRVGHRPTARAGARQGRARAAPDPGHRRDRRRRAHPAGRQPDRDRGRAGEGPRDAGALRGVVLGAAGPRRAARRRIQPAVQLARVARLQRRGTSGSRCQAWRARSRRLSISAPLSRGCSQSPPSGSFTRSARARPPRW